MTPPPPSPHDLADALIPVAAELIATVRDYGPDDVNRVLARVPGGMYHSLAVLLAAMVDPDRKPSELLAWTQQGPVRSREFTPAAYSVAGVESSYLGRRVARRTEIARLSEAGLSVPEIAARVGITERSVTRHRTAIRAAVQERAS